MRKFLVLIQLILISGGLSAEKMTALEIMQAVEDRDTGNHFTVTMEMILIDRNNNKRVRVLKGLTMEVGKDTKSIMFFQEPADVKDTAFLTWDYDDDNVDDDQWLYLPALKKNKRIASSNKSGSFMGSDFTYADMSSRPLSRYQFRIVKELLLAGINVWQIEALPDEVEIKRTGYKKSILFVRKDNFVLIRAAHILDKGGLIKYQDIKSLELIDGIWVATEIHMTTKRGKEVRHRTVLFNKDTQFNRPMQASWFTSNQLEKGLPK